MLYLSFPFFVCVRFEFPLAVSEAGYSTMGVNQQEPDRGTADGFPYVLYVFVPPFFFFFLLLFCLTNTA